MISKAKVCSSKRKCQFEMCDPENANKKMDDFILELRKKEGRIEVGRRASKCSPHGLCIMSA